MRGSLWRAALLLLLASGGAFAVKVGGRAAVPNFDYRHRGEDWLAGFCASRERQSPVDFGGAAPWGCSGGNCSEAPFFFDYEPLDHLTLVNTGRGLDVRLAGHGFGGITFNGQWFNVQSARLHAAAEHTLSGRRSALELQLLHRRVDGGETVVVAVLFDAHPPAATLVEQGSGRGRRLLGSWRGVAGAPSTAVAAGAALAALLPAPLPPGGAYLEVPVLNALDLLSPLLADGVFFQYHGSLTVPPCTEQVTWLVRRDALPVPQEQVDRLRASVREANEHLDNWRATMPLMGRLVTVRSAVKGWPAPSTDDVMAPGGTPERLVTQDFQAVAVAQAALGRANASWSMNGRLAAALGAPDPAAAPAEPAATDGENTTMASAGSGSGGEETTAAVASDEATATAVSSGEEATTTAAAATRTEETTTTAATSAEETTAAVASSDEATAAAAVSSGE